MPSITKQPLIDDVLAEALRLHAAGWWVVPQAGKRALALGWDKVRLTEDDLRGYLTPGSGLGIAVVLSQSPLLDVECDGPEAEAVVRGACGAGELLTPTWRSRRGLHRLFTRPGGLPDRAAVEAGGVEFRIGNKAALSTVPPSVGDDGQSRAWLDGLSVWDIVPSPLPAGLARLLGEVKKPAEAKAAGSETITEGGRNDELFRYGCRLLRQGFARKDIANALAGANKRQCRPPLGDAEVEAITVSVEKYRARQEAQPRTGELAPVACEEWPDLLDKWRRAIKLTDGFRRGLTVSLACCASAKIVEDQLWVKLMSPPSTGKSMIAEALAVCRDHVKCIDVFKGFYSGYQIDAEGSQNLSLLEELNGKAFVVKDGDSIMNMPNWKEVMGAARAIYDTSGRVSFRNLMSKDWEGIRFPWLLCGTKSLRQIDHSELGQRFLDCRIMDAIDDDLEEEIGWRKINAIRRNRFEVDGKPESLDSPEMVAAKQATAGYLRFLRASIGRSYAAVGLSDGEARKIIAWAKLVALFRARPSKVQDEEEAGREMSARLVSQLGKLAGCLAVVLGRSSCAGEPLSMTRQCVRDTAHGKTLKLARNLAGVRPEAGASAAGVGGWIGHGEDKARDLLCFLRALGAVEDFTPSKGLVKMKQRWRLTERARLLLEEIA